jgi:hypothetical protein
MPSIIKSKIGIVQPDWSVSAISDPDDAHAHGVVGMPFVIDILRTVLAAADSLVGSALSVAKVVVPAADIVPHSMPVVDLVMNSPDDLPTIPAVDPGVITPTERTMVGESAVVSSTADDVPHDTPVVDPVVSSPNNPPTFLAVDMVVSGPIVSRTMPGGAMPAPGTVPSGWVETPTGRYVPIDGSADDTQSPAPMDVGQTVFTDPTIAVCVFPGWVSDRVFSDNVKLPNVTPDCVLPRFIFDVVDDHIVPDGPIYPTGPTVTAPPADPAGGSVTDMVIIGRDETDAITGGMGNDMLLGMGGRDLIAGSGGNDTIISGNGDDTFSGGGGTDVFVFEAGESGVDIVVDFRVGEDKIQLAGLGYHAFVDIHLLSRSIVDLSTLVPEQAITEIAVNDETRIVLLGVEISSLSAAEFIFTDGPTDPVVATPLPDPINPIVTMHPPDPRDGTPDAFVTDLVFTGSDASEVFHGEMGNDMLIGKGDCDSLFGHGGNDTLAGGDGNDWLRGGPGADVFSFELGESGVDQVMDFVAGQDKIQFVGFGYGSFADINLITTTGSSMPGTPSETSYTTVVLNDETKIFLLGVNGSSLSAADFIFT